MRKKRFKELMCGPVVVVFTPFDETGKKVNEEALRKNVRFMIDGGIKENSGVLIPDGSTGDCFVMSMAERKRVMEIVVDEAKGEVPVVCGVNHSSTDEAIELSRYAEEIGADGVMMTPPYYWILPSDEAIFAHYKAVSDSINIGIMIYNNANIINKDMSVEFLLKLSELENVLALKECSPNMIKYKRVVETLSDKITVINGAGEWTEPLSYQLGTKAYISGFANFAPELCVEIHQAGMKKDFQRVKEIIAKFKPLQDIMTRYIQTAGGPQEARIYKEMADIAGFPMGAPRLPVLPLTNSFREEVEEAMKKGGFVRF